MFGLCGLQKDLVDWSVQIQQRVVGALILGPIPQCSNMPEATQQQPSRCSSSKNINIQSQMRLSNPVTPAAVAVIVVISATATVPAAVKGH
jgi:hypothetical protein